MESATSYIPDKVMPCFWIGYYKLGLLRISEMMSLYEHNGWSIPHVNLKSGVCLPLIHCPDYRIKYETLCFIMQHGIRVKENYLSDFLTIYPVFEISSEVASEEPLIALQYTPEALAWLTEYFGLKIADIPPEAPEGFSHKPLIFFLFTNSD